MLVTPFISVVIFVFDIPRRLTSTLTQILCKRKCRWMCVHNSTTYPTYK